ESARNRTANQKHGAIGISEDADAARRGNGVDEFLAGAKLKGVRYSGVAILDSKDRIPPWGDSPAGIDRKNSALVVVASLEEDIAGERFECRVDCCPTEKPRVEIPGGCHVVHEYFDPPQTADFFDQLRALVRCGLPQSEECILGIPKGCSSCDTFNV